MSFKIPDDSLGRRYSEAYRQFSWEGVRTESGVKILPSIREQTGPTCIYEAIATRMETYLRLKGITSKLSAKDLQDKEQALMTEERDRTLRCIEVVKSIGICSEDDYNSQNPNPTVYTFKRVHFFFKLYEPHFRRAVEKMREGPLLVVFHVGLNYNDYVVKFQQQPVLSYEQYAEGRMRGHGACAIAYGTESIVPFWKIMNSHSDRFSTKGFGRVLPQNAIYLAAPEELVVHEPEAAPAPPVAPAPPSPANARKRKASDSPDDDHTDGNSEAGTAPPPLKKRRLGHHI